MTCPCDCLQCIVLKWGCPHSIGFQLVSSPYAPIIQVHAPRCHIDVVHPTPLSTFHTWVAVLQVRLIGRSLHCPIGHCHLIVNVLIASSRIPVFFARGLNRSQCALSLVAMSLKRPLSGAEVHHVNIFYLFLSVAIKITFKLDLLVWHATSDFESIIGIILSHQGSDDEFVDDADLQKSLMMATKKAQSSERDSRQSAEDPFRRDPEACVATDSSSPAEHVAFVEEECYLIVQNC